MRQLTLKGYLRQYVPRLSTQDKGGLFRLAAEAKTNYRLRAPLFLHALCENKIDVLLSFTKDEALKSHYTEMANKYTFDVMMSALENGDASLGENYHKAYNSYVRRRDMPKTHEQAKLAIRDKIRSLQKTKSVSNYRLYTDLKLNPGNINNYLKNGATSKVSRNTARRIMLYLEAIALGKV